MVTSTTIGEGKTFVAANLGITLAQGVDQRSLLVDCDLRHPALAALFGLPQQRGLADFLASGTDLANLILKTSVDKLTLLPSGRPPVNPSELLGSAKMDGLVREMADRYDDRFIIFDTPPLLAASEALVLSQKVDGVVLVVRQGVADRNQIKRVIELIGREKVLGVVFNGYVRSCLEQKLFGQYAYYGNYNKPSPSANG
jgi:exopolysaccharide/PEP-CTERM locus tyrosine autokinase